MPSVRSPRYQPWSLMLALIIVISLVLMRWRWTGTAYLPEIVVVVVSALMLLLAFRASWEAETVERLWVKDYLPARLRLHSDA